MNETVLAQNDYKIKTYTNRTIKSTEGIINIFTACFGARVSSFIKYCLGRVAKAKSKHQRKQKLQQWINESDKESNSTWKHRFIRLINSTNDILTDEMMEAFYKDEIRKLQDAQTIEKTNIVVVCTERNELTRMKAFLAYYRSIGIKKFLICDNGSSDGTLEHLKEQSDVSLYYTKAQFNSRTKAAWNNRMMAESGDNCWYLVVDADEFAWVPELSTMGISEYVQKLKEEKIYAVKALMLEMYPNGTIGGGREQANKSFEENYCYFDRANKYYLYNKDTNAIEGAFVNRVFEDKHAMQCKTPLFYQTECRFHIGAHHIYPFYDDITAKYGMILKHYKFLPGDEERIRDAIKNKNYANGSRLYKKFVKLYDDETISAYDDEISVRWEDATVQEYLPFIKEVTRG